MNLPTLSAVIEQEELSEGAPVWVARCPELDVTTQGFSIEHAHEMLREAVELVLEVASESEIQARLSRGARVLPLKLAA